MIRVVHYPKALPYLKAYARFAHQSEGFPIAFAAISRTISLPMYPELDPDAARKIAGLLGALVNTPGTRILQEQYR